MVRRPWRDGAWTVISAVQHGAARCSGTILLRKRRYSCKSEDLARDEVASADSHDDPQADDVGKPQKLTCSINVDSL